MKSLRLTILFIAVMALIEMPILAQQGGSLVDRFKQLDHDGDRRIVPTELPIPRPFKALDGNGDGAITVAEARAAVAEMTPEDRRKLGAAIRSLVGGTDAQPDDAPEATGYRSSYYKNGEIHVNVLGTPEEKPLTAGHWDFKPSWSKTGDMLVFFRRLVNHREVSQWKTAICIINIDGSGFHQLTDGTHTDFNQTWTRDGTNTPIWNRRKPDGGGYTVMASKVGAKPGEEYVLSGEAHHTWAYTCLTDGRIFVSSRPPKLRRGYYLMTPNRGGEPKYESVTCELTTSGTLDRVSISPSETKICFDFTRGFQHKLPGRTLYVADFDAKTRTITNAKPFANKDGKPIWFDYPRWTKDESAIVYHAGGKLFLYTLSDGSTKQVSTDDKADYRYPHGEATPK